MDYLPLFLNIKNQNCLVVGAGSVASRKVELLLQAGANITVVAKDISPDILALQNQQRLSVKQKAFADSDLANMRLVIAATNDNTVNTAVATAANQLKLLVNVVDTPALCDFIVPAIVDRSPIIIAISSGGVSPVLARLLRAKIETVIPSPYGVLAKLAEKWRPKIKQHFTQSGLRRIFWEKVLQGHIAELVFSGDIAEAEKQLELSLQSSDTDLAIGEVYLVGAGPGDPDLLTFRALRLMQQADVVVYDRLVSQEVLALTRRDAEKIYVGKQRQNHSLPQEDINSLLANLALAGKRVVRLKGGDPFIFGRGGEEIETLVQQGIPFQVVPGITAASGCASYAGIPLTHRDHAQSCLFVTGHLKDGSINLNWQQLATPNQTVVIYMGLVGLETICQQMIAHGCPETHAIAIIQQGTTQSQRVIIGTLADMPEKVLQANLKAPTLIIIGSVVTLHQQLQWFYPQSEERGI